MKTQIEPLFTEDALIEQPSIEIFESMGWTCANCYSEWDTGRSTLGRETKSDVVLVDKLRPKLIELNPDLPTEAIETAIKEILRDRKTMSLIAANKDIYQLLKTGVKVEYRDNQNAIQTGRVQVIDWNDPGRNDWFLAQQFWIQGDLYLRRTDLVGFVNGIPLLFIELKAVHANLKHAYVDNLTDYKTEQSIRHLFWYNAFIILSNGSKGKIGTITSEWEHFSDWKKINDEGEVGVVALDTILRGTCEPTKLLDLVENFILFIEAKKSVKVVAKNHQYLGVNKAIHNFTTATDERQKLGVFWHTQGSGKSISMVFFAQKILRKVPGNWTFLIVTDRDELDDQIYKNFVAAGVVSEAEAQATSGDHLQQLLREDHRYVFTLIQKFHNPVIGKFPKLSNRSDIIVIADEAHRSQYDTFARNMRLAIPNASFIAFTGTPLMTSGEEKTKETFGEYVSVYNFKQSIDDEATVPLYYENRIPELQLKNDDLNEELMQLIEDADIDETKREEFDRKIEREFRRQYQLITRDDRLEKIAEDVVAHFMGRGFAGKAMVICIDKATAVKMYDKVQVYWKRKITELKKQLATVSGDVLVALEQKIAYMETTDMAVVVSQSQNEIADLRKKGVEIEPHRRRMIKEALDDKFKDADDPFRIVFVCAMWMTGFDVPCCSTIYLDKLMRNHTLMQTIARANRVFRNLQKALAIYGTGAGGKAQEGDSPVASKSELIDLLRKQVTEAVAFCNEHDVDPLRIYDAENKLLRIRLLKDAVEHLIVNDDTKKTFIQYANHTELLYKAILPDPLAEEFVPVCTVMRYLRKGIEATVEGIDISGFMAQVAELLDRSIAAEGYVIDPKRAEKVIDLSKVDFEKLRKRFERSRKRMELERLKAAIKIKLNILVVLNNARTDYLKMFEEMIDDYNAGSINVEQFFDELVKFAQKLNAEEQRTVTEGLTEEELAIFDLLTKPEMKLTKAEEVQVKSVAKELLDKLKTEMLVLEWRKRQQTRAAVRVCIERYLDKLPPNFTTDLFQRKCDQTFNHFYEKYTDARHSVYSMVA